MAFDLGQQNSRQRRLRQSFGAGFRQSQPQRSAVYAGHAGVRFASIVTAPAASRVITVQPVTINDSGSPVNDGPAVQVFTWPGLLGADFEELRLAAAIILLVESAGDWWANQTVPWYMTASGSLLADGSC